MRGKFHSFYNYGYQIKLKQRVKRFQDFMKEHKNPPPKKKKHN